LLFLPIGVGVPGSAKDCGQRPRRVVLVDNDANRAWGYLLLMPSEELVLHQDYNRQQLHDLFEPETPFTPQAGSWGLHGIVRLARRPGDFVVIVTFGRSQGEHTFDEGISAEGILRWQSQPQQGLADRTVQDFIAHNEDRNAIYLFLRTAARARGTPRDYTYLGRLKYAGHDRERERPVHFAWQLLEWPIPVEVMSRMNLTLEPDDDRAAISATLRTGTARSFGQLVEEPAPVQQAMRGESTRSFQASKRSRRPEHEDRALGLAGELLILERERQALIVAGHPELAGQVVHTAAKEGDGAGFDISSFFHDGRRKFVEVKTTTGAKEADFFISANEVAFALECPESYELCRVFDYDRESNSGRYYVVPGSTFRSLRLTPTQFRIGQLTDPWPDAT
jgi:hypothetical protein